MPQFPQWLSPPLATAEVSVEELRVRRFRYPAGSGEAEEFAFFAGLKPAFRQLLTREQAQQKCARLEQQGYRVSVLSVDAWKGPAFERAVLLVAKEEPRLSELVAMERALNESETPTKHWKEQTEALGTLLGFPSCCVRAFVEQESSVSYSELLRAAQQRTHGVGHALLNVCDLQVFHWISWIPCSFRCEWSLRFAEELDELLQPRMGEFLRSVRSALAATCVVLSDDVQLCADGHWSGEEFLLENVRPFASLRHHASVLSTQEEAEVKRALGELRGARSVSHRERLLLRDGEPWAEGWIQSFA